MGKIPTGPFTGYAVTVRGCAGLSTSPRREERMVLHLKGRTSRKEGRMRLFAVVMLLIGVASPSWATDY